MSDTSEEPQGQFLDEMFTHGPEPGDPLRWDATDTSTTLAKAHPSTQKPPKDSDQSNRNADDDGDKDATSEIQRLQDKLAPSQESSQEPTPVRRYNRRLQRVTTTTNALREGLERRTLEVGWRRAVAEQGGDSLLRGLFNSNPEGINQYTKGGVNEAVEAAKAGDKQAMSEIVDTHQSMIRGTAGKLIKPHNPGHDDLVSEGNHALLKDAVPSFDSSKGVPFSGYAHLVVKRAMLDYLSKQGTIGKHEKSATQQKEEDKTWDPADKRQASKDHSEEISKGLSSLSDRERDVVSHFFGLGAHERMTMKELAEKHGVSIPLISQIKDKAVAKMREHVTENTFRLMVLNSLERRTIDVGWRQATDEYGHVFLRNVFCPTGVGGGVNPHCSPSRGTTTGHVTTSGHNLHTQAGLVAHLAANTPHKLTQLILRKFAHLNPNGIQSGTLVVPYPHLSKTGDATGNQKKLDELADILPVGTKFITKSVAEKDLAQVGALSPPAPTPRTAPQSNIPFKDETKWETGKPQVGQVLNGVPFAPAPHHFWEKTPDVDVSEPKPLRPIDRVGIMIKEPDGRVWIVQPTNGFGNRNHTLPGGGVEKGLTNQQNALKEVWEETGLQVKITGHLGDFTDSNNGNNGRLYVGERIGGAPWDAKIEDGKHGGPTIIDRRTGQPAAESETVKLVTPEKASQLLHRTDDLAQLATVHPIPLSTSTSGNMMKKLVDGLKPAADAYAKEKQAKKETPGSELLHVVQEIRGFNDKPAVVSKNDMDSLIKQGTHIEMLRGVQGHGSLKAKDLADAFKTGDHYPGYGCFGDGTYADSNKGFSNAAIAQYSGYGSGDIIRIALPKTAKIIKQSDLENQVASYPSGFTYSDSHSKDQRWKSIQAALAGYDAVHVDGKSSYHGSYGKGYYVILNRSILTVQKESAKGHVIS